MTFSLRILLPSVFKKWFCPVFSVIDGVWSMVGSSNMDSLSFRHNTETNAVMLDTVFAKKMEAMFIEDLAISDEIFPAQWDQRSWTNRIKETLARLFEYWL
ncbi:MAG: phospholipase D-like domain-containing protein [Desulfotignum sp.]